jgi:hypothetical protein
LQKRGERQKKKYLQFAQDKNFEVFFANSFWRQKIQWLNKGFRKKKQDNPVVCMVGQTKF